jgi:hypothetical protein
VLCNLVFIGRLHFDASIVAKGESALTSFPLNLLGALKQLLAFGSQNVVLHLKAHVVSTVLVLD